MNHKIRNYLVNKIFSIVIFIIFYLFVVYLQEKINEYLPFGMWGLNTIGLIINLTFGVIIGWFLLDDIKLKLNKHQNIATICILIFLSLYQYFFYAPILNKYLSFELFYAVKYPQLILGAYLVLYLKKFFKEKT